MSENGEKSFLKKVMYKYVLVKPKEEKITPIQFVISALACILFFVCLMVIKLPYNTENAPLLNCYYILLTVFALVCFAYHVFDKDKVRQHQMLLAIKLLMLALCCLGIYLFISHFEYITAHLNEWGGFNKVG